MFLETFIGYLAAAIPVFLLGLYVGRDIKNKLRAEIYAIIIKIETDEYGPWHDFGTHFLIDDLQKLSIMHKREKT